MRTSYLDYNRGDSFDARGDRWVSPDIERGYYRFDLARYMGAYKGEQVPYNVTVQLGRDLVYWANGLAMGSVLGHIRVSQNPRFSRRMRAARAPSDA